MVLGIWPCSAQVEKPLPFLEEKTIYDRRAPIERMYSAVTQYQEAANWTLDSANHGDLNQEHQLHVSPSLTLDEEPTWSELC